jgi:predicted Fe-S protein YdhL (DUF1289 family)
MATIFCINDNAYFCDSCDKNYHENLEYQFMANHDRVRVTARPDRFGLCSVRAHADKGKENEYYCHCCNKTYCSSCLIDGISDENKGPDHKLVNIQKAYNDAKEEASAGA